MDSCNSGSLQSSSGGDEEYDSRAVHSVPAFMSCGSISNPTLPPSPYFDPLSSYLQLHQNPNSSLLNSNPAWPKTLLRSDQNPVTHDNIVNPILPTTSLFMQSFQPPAAAGVDNSCGIPTLAPPLLNQIPAATSNPKKRSRASRRAPTTVLTTDTTNFRAMVQEFTGIPAPPFSNSSFARNRLDLFGLRSNSLDGVHLPPYICRSFSQKVQPPHSLLSSAVLDAVAASSPTSNNNNIASHVSSTTSAADAIPSINYQLPITQNWNLFNIPNPLLTSPIQSNPKFPFSTSPVSGSKPTISFEIPSNIDHSHSKIGSLDEQFRSGHGNHLSETLTGLSNLIPSDQIALRNDHNDNTDSNNAARWSDNPVSRDGDKDDGMNLRSLSANYDFPRNTLNNKMSFLASSTSNLHEGKAPENVSARGEGMMESWIFSSE